MNDSNLIKTEFNDETREYFTNYFLEKPCTPSVMDYLLYNVFDKPFSMASSSCEFDENDEKNNISQMEAFIIRVAKKYLHHYHFLSREDDPVKGMIEAWIHNREDDENENIEYPVRNVHDLFDIDENENVYTVLFWLKKGGIMEYGYSEESFEEFDGKEENKKYTISIDQNMVMILPDYVYFKPYVNDANDVNDVNVTSTTSQQYIMVHICV